MTIVKPGAPMLPVVPVLPVVLVLPALRAPRRARHARRPWRSRRSRGLRRPARGPRARIAQDDDPPLTFTNAFYAITMTITASADGLTGEDLPISIEDICDVPPALATEAAQLVGGDGVAIITPATPVFDATGLRLTGDAATTAVAGADTVVIKAKLLRPAGWRQDEDGAPVPTFSVSRTDIPD